MHEIGNQCQMSFLHNPPNVFKAGSFSESGSVNAVRLPGQQAAAPSLISSSPLLALKNIECASVPALPVDVRWLSLGPHACVPSMPTLNHTVRVRKEIRCQV